jgi:hypothetical protein
VLYHRIAATGGFFVAEILGVMWPAIQKPKTLKDYRRKSLLAEMSVGVSQWRRSQRYEAAMLSANFLEYMLKQAIITKFIWLGNDHLESIFSDGGNGPLSTFSAKIKLVHALPS